MSQTVLIVEDEIKIARWVREYFENAGFDVLMAHDAPTGLAMARSERPDIMILDLMLPGSDSSGRPMDGLDVCRAIRRESDLPIIMLTARAEETDRLIGLELGADDYVVKPFSPRELVARAKAVLRRVQPASPRDEILRAGDFTVDVARRACARAGEEIDLTPTEFEILATLMRHRGQPLTRAQLMDLALGQTYIGYERNIDVHIRNLRRKIEPDPANPTYIETVFGVGYRFTDEEQ